MSPERKITKPLCEPHRSVVNIKGLPDMDPHRYYSNWVEINLDAIRENIKNLKTHTGVEIMVVVKANAYGHCAATVARAALESGASWLAVARPIEVAEIRRAGILAPLFLLGYLPPERIEEVMDNNVSLALWSMKQLEEITAVASRIGRKARVHLKVDTGMSRLGAQPENVMDLAQAISRDPNVELEGLFTHFAKADDVDRSSVNAQEQLFNQVIGSLDEVGIHPPIIHAANSAAALTQPTASYDMIRTGNAIYGLDPDAGHCQLPRGFRPVISWKSVLSQVKVLPPGRGISYGHTYTTTNTERIGTIPVGYADGFRRTGGNKVIVGGKLLPVIGRVCMDMIHVQLDEVPEAKQGDEVILIGEQAGANWTANDVAQVWNTINYEVVCAIGARVPRVYIG